MNPNSQSSDPFFYDHIKILIQPNRLTEFFPSESLPQSRYINAIARFLIYFSLFYFLFTQSIGVLPILIFLLWILKMFSTRQQSSDTISQSGAALPVSEITSLNQPSTVVPVDGRLYQSLDQNWDMRNHQSEINHPPGDQSDFGKFLFKDAQCRREAEITRFDRPLCQFSTERQFH